MEHRCAQLEELDKDGEYQVETTRAGGWGLYATVSRRLTELDKVAEGISYCPFCGKELADVVESMPYTDRGGYGSTGERSAGASIAEGRTFRDANGLELHVGDYVIDELGELYCVMGLHEGDGAAAAYADLGNSRTSLEVAPCLSLRLDERPHDCDGAPIEVGDVLYQTTFEGEPIGDPMEVKRHTGNALFVKGFALPINAWSCTHREPDSWEKLSEDALKYQCAYFFGISEDKNTTCVNCKKSSEVTGIPCRLNMQIDLVKRAKRLAGIEEQEGE